MMAFLYVFSLCILIMIVVVVRSDQSVKRPNIVFIIADDLGWNDVSFHGSDQIPTPNIDLLAYTGVALERYYTHAVCSPTRAAMLTGKFGHKLGMQGYPITQGEDRGLSLSEKILPQYLKELGYATHLVGKWHTEGSRSKYLPNNRGFDSYFGHVGGYIDYYEYTLEENWCTGTVAGMCLYRNTTPAWDVKGYITDVYTEEAISIIKKHDISKPLFLNIAHNAPHCGNDGALLQAPPEDVRAMRHVELPARRIYAAMVKKLDESVGKVVKALYEKEILQNTILVFVSDNGGMSSGPASNYASNWPLRGLKMSPFEGGIRVPGLIWTPNLQSHLWKGYMHVVDWLPTLLRAAGANVPSDIDGIDLWNQIISNETSLRNEMYEIVDEEDHSYVLMVSGDYKIITGNARLDFSDYQGDDMRGIIGHAPSYEHSIRNSKIYSVLKKIGKEFSMEDIDLRWKTKINCKEKVRDSKTACYPQNGTVCLYNIMDDPCETTDIAAECPDLVKNMTALLLAEAKKKIPRTPLYRDPRSAPKFFNYTWTTFAEHI